MVLNFDEKTWMVEIRINYGFPGVDFFHGISIDENKKNLPLVLGFWLLVNWTNEFQNFKQRLQTKSGQINIASLERRGWLLKKKGTKLRAVETIHYDCHIKEKKERWNSLMWV